MIPIMLVRHGRTAWNAGQGQAPRFRGTIDLPLAADGLVQARATSRRLAGLPLAAVYSSPLRRAASTAQAIAQPHGLSVRTLPGLASIKYGDWAGRTHDAVAQLWTDLFRRWHEDPFSVQFPAGERQSDLRERATDALRATVSCHNDGDTLVFVTHQAVALTGHQIVNKVAACTLLGLDTDDIWCIKQDPCVFNVFHRVDDVWHSLTLNDSSHL